VIPVIISKSSLVAIRLNHIVQECHWGHKIKSKVIDGSVFNHTNHGSKVSSSFFVASSDSTKLFERIDGAFHDIHLAVVLFVDRTFATFMAAPSEGDRLARQHLIIAK
jgi:hypothetical protein